MSLIVKFTKQFTGIKIDVDFSMENELLVLFGPSGSGKSVTLKFIAGLLKPDNGHLCFNDNELFNSYSNVCVKPQHRSIGYVFQNHSIFPHMTVMENIIFGAKGINKEESLLRAKEMVELFNLHGQENKYPHQISGGQQQRTALAMSLIRRPKALLLDEPFSALDSELRLKMRECIKGVIKSFNIPIILVTHDKEEARLMADRILMIKNGRNLPFNEAYFENI